MALRLTPEQAKRMGLIQSSGKAGSVKKDRRESIKDILNSIAESRCDIVFSEDSKKALIRIVGAEIQSLNKVIRYDMRREFHSINKQWAYLIAESLMVSKKKSLIVADDEQVSVHVHTIRKKLLDPDNICVKSQVDAVHESNIIEDDSPDIISHVTTTQEKGKQGIIYIELLVVKKKDSTWNPDAELLSMLEGTTCP